MRQFFLLGLLFFSAGCESRHDLGNENTYFGKLEGSYKSIERNIIRPQCVRCHSGSNAPHGILLSSYEEIMSGAVFPPLIIPGKPNDSSLYKSIASGKMPKESRRLNDEELKAIYDWILSGAAKAPGSDEPPDDGEEPPDDSLSYTKTVSL